MKRLCALPIALVLSCPVVAVESDVHHLRYVLARGGLHLRESADPDSRTLAIAPYGTTVTVLAAAPGDSMRVDNLSGGMAKVTMSGQTGFMFDGFLSRYPAPDKGTPLQRYVDIARNRVAATVRPHYERHYYDRDGHIIAEEGITLFQVSWQQAFLLAAALADIPAGIHFPVESREASQTVENPDKLDEVWIDELEVRRDASGQITSMRYAIRREGGGRFVLISPGEDKDGLRIMLGAIGD